MIDLYLKKEAESKGIELSIIEENALKCLAHIRYKNLYYIAKIDESPVNQGVYSLLFGTTNFAYKGFNLNMLLNKETSPLILATLFGLLREWVDKYNIKQFEYKADGHVRQILYSLYLIKHFPDFVGQEDENKIMIWTRK